MHPSPLPSALALRPFATREALAAGVSADRLRARDLVSPHRGVHTARGALGSEDRAAALVRRCADFVPLLRDDESFAHVTALALWGLPVPTRSTVGPLHVATRTSRQRRRPGVVGHRFAADARSVTLDGLPVVEPVAAWVQSATALRLDEMVAVGDALTGRWSDREGAHGLDLEVLVDAVARARGRRGVAVLRAALDLVRPGAWSPKETETRLLLVRGGIPEPLLNAPALAPDGTYLGRPDLSWPRVRVGVEYEGDAHRERGRFRADVDRVEAFHDAGWRLVRFSDDSLAPWRRDGSVAMVARALRDRGMTW